MLEILFKLTVFSLFLQIKQWCEEAGGQVTIKFIQKDPKVPATKIDDSNPFWVAFESAMKEL